VLKLRSGETSNTAHLLRTTFRLGMLEISIRAKTIKGPDNPTSQLLPIMSNKCCSGTGKEGKTKEVVEDREVKQVVCEELCVIKCM